jgi:hypothetical protein
VVEGQQALLADVFLVGAQVGEDLGRLLRAMHSEVLVTRKARISRNHQAL